MTFDAFLHQLPDSDPAETTEWLESLDTLVATEGVSRARFVIGKLAERARSLNVGVPAMVSTPYINTIPPEEEPWFPGDEEMERRIRRIVRWNAAVMVTRANKRSDGIGGHLSTYASAASLYEVGFNHFFRGKDDGRSGDQIYYQGHAAPGMYSRAFLEGRLTEEHLDNFRHESGGKGLSSYPHPRLMPDFWEFPTVSMGLGPLNAIYQARFNRYLYQRKIADTSESRVWAFLGDGEMDEPESTGALALAAREQLDNLIFVISCNLQRLDGPVRGNSKIIQELESVFRGAGWNVVKVIWAREWDPLLARDVDGVLVDKMNSTNDGQFQKYSTDDTGAYIRENFFGPDPRLRKLVEHLSDDDLRHLRRGGHDYRKLYSAYRLALEQKGAPTVILAHTVKGWTLGSLFEGRNATHQIKKIGDTELKAFRDKLQLPISDKQLEDGIAPYYHPGSRSEEIDYLMTRRLALGGTLPKRVVRERPLTIPDRLGVVGGDQGKWRTRCLDHGCVRRHPPQPASRPRGGQPDRPDHPRRGAHLRHGRALPRGEDLRALRSALRAGRRQHGAELPGVARRTAARRGHHRSRGDGLVHRGGNRLRHPRRADDPVLHLLLDVRLPACRRPGVGVWRRARPWLHARRHRRADHPER